LSSVGGFFLDISTQTGAYTPGGTWTFQGSMGNLGLNSFRDDFVTFSPVANVRSVRFTISPSLANVVFSLGKFFVGSMTDLGGIHSPGGTRTPMKNRLEIPLPSGVTVISILGDDGMMFTHPWRSASSTVRDAWVQAFLQRGSIAFLDWEDHIYEVFLKDGQYTETKGFSNTWDIDVTLVRLP
jgi:hypothetical protein